MWMFAVQKEAEAEAEDMAAAEEDMEHMVEEGHMVRVGMALPPLAEPLLEPLPLVQPVPFRRGAWQS